jgi:hypothetical protein
MPSMRTTVASAGRFPRVSRNRSRSRTASRVPTTDSAGTSVTGRSQYASTSRRPSTRPGVAFAYRHAIAPPRECPPTTHVRTSRSPSCTADAFPWESTARFAVISGTTTVAPVSSTTRAADGRYASGATRPPG